MFRVPMYRDEPTFDRSFKVTFWQWLRSSASQRDDWRQRRDAAARLAAYNQRLRGEQLAWNAIYNQQRDRVMREVDRGQRTREDAEQWLRLLHEGRVRMMGER